MSKYILLVSLAMTIAGCASLIDNTQTATLTKQVGWFYDKCLVINALGLTAGTALTLFDADASQNVFRSRIITPASGANECAPLADDRKSVNAEDGNFFYLITKPKETQAGSTFNLGIAVVHSYKNGSQLGTETLDLDNDGTADLFSYCATSEGINFTVWSAAPYKSKKLWNGYYYLGYDIEPNCPEM